MTRDDIQKTIIETGSAIDEINQKLVLVSDLTEKELLLQELKRMEYRMLQYKDRLGKLDMN
ncbi:MAG: hypothetical protein ACM3QW_03205 [Ignavibacteriales bacterium]